MRIEIPAVALRRIIEWLGIIQAYREFKTTCSETWRQMWAGKKEDEGAWFVDSHLASFSWGNLSCFLFSYLKQWQGAFPSCRPFRRRPIQSPYGHCFMRMHEEFGWNPSNWLINRRMVIFLLCEIRLAGWYVISLYLGQVHANLYCSCSNCEAGLKRGSDCKMLFRSLKQGRAIRLKWMVVSKRDIFIALRFYVLKVSYVNIRFCRSDRRTNGKNV